MRPDTRVVRPRRPGKGVALRMGFQAARGDFIVMIDADGSMDPAEIDECLSRLHERRLAPEALPVRRATRSSRGRASCPEAAPTT